MSDQNRIRELRREAGISQETLGIDIGCNKSKISKLENGKQELTHNWMKQISRALNVYGLNTTPSDLLPLDHVYHSQEEKFAVDTIRALKEPEKQAFNAMMYEFANKNKA